MVVVVVTAVVDVFVVGVVDVVVSVGDVIFIDVISVTDVVESLDGFVDDSSVPVTLLVVVAVPKLKNTWK